MLGQVCRVFPLPKPWIVSRENLCHSANVFMTQIRASRSVRTVALIRQRHLMITTEHIARLLVEFQLDNTDVVPPGWVVRVLARCSIPYVEIWDVFHQMYESQVCDVIIQVLSNSQYSSQGSPVQLTIGCPDTFCSNMRAFPRLVRGGKALSWCIFPCGSYRHRRGTVSPRASDRGCSEGYTRGL
jgi:hypothetical protein